MHKERNTSLDLFRCVCMFLVVLYHSYQHSAYWHVSRIYDIAFYYLLFWHVDGFLSLSGRFGIKFSLGKFWRLYSVIVFYSVLSIVIGHLCLGVKVPFRITGGWYGNTYLCLMLVVPLLNEGINGLVAKGARFAYCAWLGFAVVMFVNWMSGNSYIGLIAYDIGPFSLVQMVFVYFTVRLVRLTDIAKVIRWPHLVLVIGFYCCVAVVLPSRTNYIAPHTIAMAVAMLTLFEKYVKAPKWLEHVAVWAAPSMFGVYLLHEITCFGKSFHRVPIEWMTRYGCPPAIAIVFGAIACFVMCILIETFRRFLVDIVVRMLSRFR